MEPPDAQMVARRLLILLALKQHAQRLMMQWDFGFRIRASLQAHLGVEPTWKSLGWRGGWMKLKTRWRFWNECRMLRRGFRRSGLWPELAESERKFVALGLSQLARDAANDIFWQIEAIACLAWALNLSTDLPPPDQPTELDLDEDRWWSSPEEFIDGASLRSRDELKAARESVKRWHWRARQHLLELHGQLAWPPPDAPAEALADLAQRGIVSLDSLNRLTARTLLADGLLKELIDEDFPAHGKAYRELTEAEAGELEQLAHHRHKALNWICGLAPHNSWDSTPVET